MNDGEMETEGLGSFFSFAEEYCEFAVKDRLKNTVNKSLYNKLPGILKLHIWEYINCHIPGENYLSVMREFKNRFKTREYKCAGNSIIESCNNVYNDLLDYGCPKSSPYVRIWNKYYGLTKINTWDKKYDNVFHDYDSDGNINDKQYDITKNFGILDSENEHSYSYYCSEKCVEKTIQLQNERQRNIRMTMGTFGGGRKFLL